MARGSRVVFNRKAMPQIDLAMGDGLFEVGKQMVEKAAGNAPDDPRMFARRTSRAGTEYWGHLPGSSGRGEGLPKQGGVLLYVDGKKAGGWSTRGGQPRAPRAAKVTKRMGVVVIAGFGFPARLNERGTLNSPAHPFVQPAFDSIAPQTARIMAPITSARLKGMR